MSVGSLQSTFSLDITNWIGSMQQAGKVTQTEADRMSRMLKSVNDQLKDLSRYGNVAANSANTEKAAESMGHFGFQTAAAKRELLVLAHELSQGNYSRFGGSLLVLAERTNAMELAFSAAGLAIGATALLVGGFVAAAIAGAIEADKFARSLVSTGNAAGLTASNFDSLAAVAATATNSTIRSSKNALQDLVNTGRFSNDVIGAATQAVLNMERVTGQSSDEIVKEFAKMGDGVAKWAAEYNKQHHYLTVEQFKYIKQLEDQGKKEDAERENLRLIAAQTKTAAENVGLLAAAWREAKTAFSAFIDGAMNIGKALTDAQKLAALRVQLAQVEQMKPGSSLFGGDSQAMLDKRKAALTAQIESLREQMRFAEQAATAKATQAKIAEKGIDAIMNPPKSTLDPHAYQSLLVDIQKYNEESDILAGTTKKLGEADRWAADMHSRLGKEIDKVSEVQRRAIDAAIIAAGLRRKDAEERKKAADMEAEFQKWYGQFQQKSHERPFADMRDEGIGKWIRDAADQAKHAEALVTGAMSRMEDAVINFAKTGKLHLGDLFSFMAEDYLRNLIRMAEKNYLLDAGKGDSFIGFGNLFNGVAGWVSGLFGSHAQGLNYVPYDGYPAILHEGERVMTRAEASTERSGGGAGIVINNGPLHVGSNVSRSEVAQAIDAGNRRTVEHIRRLDRQGRFA